MAVIYSDGPPVYPEVLTVSSDAGLASRIVSSCMGIYRKIKGQDCNGRPTWRNVSNDQRILYFSGINVQYNFGFSFFMISWATVILK